MRRIHQTIDTTNDKQRGVLRSRFEMAIDRLTGIQKELKKDPRAVNEGTLKKGREDLKDAVTDILIGLLGTGEFQRSEASVHKGEPPVTCKRKRKCDALHANVCVNSGYRLGNAPGPCTCECHAEALKEELGDEALKE